MKESKTRKGMNFYCQQCARIPCLQTLSHLILTTTLRDWYSRHPHFTAEITEASKQPLSQGCLAPEPGLSPLTLAWDLAPTTVDNSEEIASVMCLVCLPYTLENVPPNSLDTPPIFSPPIGSVASTNNSVSSYFEQDLGLWSTPKHALLPKPGPSWSVKVTS